MSENIDSQKSFGDKQIQRNKHVHMNDKIDIECKCKTQLQKVSRISVEVSYGNRMKRSKFKNVGGGVIHTETVTCDEGKKKLVAFACEPENFAQSAKFGKIERKNECNHQPRNY